MELTKQKIAPALLAILFALVACFPSVADAQVGNINVRGAQGITADQAQQAAQQATQNAANNPTAENQQAAQDSERRAQEAEQTRQQSYVPPSESDGCGILNIGDCIVDAVGWAVLGFSTFLLGMAGALFNFVVVKSVFQFSTIVGNSPGLLLAWGILRDLGNMLLLFGFIFMGLATILNLQSFPAKKAIPKLLIFAVLMNFSLFAAEAVIDTSNAFATVVYNQSAGDACSRIRDTNVNSPGGTNLIQDGVNSALLSEDCFINTGIGGNIMSATGLTTMFAFKTEDKLQSITVYLGLSLFAIVGAIVMLAAAIMLAIRAIVLIFVMVLSPIGFAGMAIPMLNGVARQWWDALLKQSFFAPIMLVLILVSLKVSEGFAGTGGNASLAGALMQPSTGVMGVIFVFLVVIGLLIASLMAARQFGAMGSAGAINWSNKIVRGAVGGSASVLGRNTIGSGSSFAQKKYNSWMANEDGNKTIRKALRVTGFDKSVVAGLDAGQKATFGGSSSYKSKKEEKEKRDKELKAINRKDKNQRDVNAATTDTAMAQALSRMNDTERAELKAIKEGGEKLDLIARNLSPEAFDKIMNNKDISDERKTEMRNKRFAPLKETVEKAKAAAAAAQANPGNTSLEAANKAAQKELANGVKNLTGKDIGQLAQSKDHANLLNDVEITSLLSEDQYKDARKNTNLSVQQRQELENSRESRLGDPVAVAGRMRDMNPEAVGKLPGKVLADAQVLSSMSGKQLAAIDPDKLNPAELAAISTFIKNETARNSVVGDEFTALFISNPKVNERWAGHV